VLGVSALLVASLHHLESAADRVPGMFRRRCVETARIRRYCRTRARGSDYVGRVGTCKPRMIPMFEAVPRDRITAYGLTDNVDKVTLSISWLRQCYLADLTVDNRTQQPHRWLSGRAQLG